MKNVTYDLIQSFKPCYDPIRHIPKDYNEPLTTFLKNDKVPFQDRLWVVMRTEFVSERLMRLFAVWCARQVQHLMTDPRSIHALDVAERFANGEATEAELSAAESAAYAAESAASAAESAALSAAWSAAWSDALYAAWSAARSAAWSAAYAAWSARSAWSAESAESAQYNKLLEMIEAENK